MAITINHNFNHWTAVCKASHRERVTRYETVGNRVVKVVYTLVHSTNTDELAKAKRNIALGQIARGHLKIHE